MDLDAAIEPDLDSLGLYLPLPYRIASLLVLGIWAWGANLHYLHILRIDLPALIRYPPRASPTAPSHHLATYRLAAILSILLCVSLSVFWTLTKGHVSAVLHYEALPQAYLVLFAFILILPVRVLSKNGRYRFLSTLRRVSLGGIALTKDGKFADILLADVLTSYAKVMGDIFVSGCMFFSPIHSSTSKPDRGCGGRFVVPFVIAIPSLIRLRQCVIEFIRARRDIGKPGSSGTGFQHLANALKYSTAFPVIILSAMQRGLDQSKEHTAAETRLFRLWLFFVFLNSFYSFWWDVVKDWDLSLFTGRASEPSHAYGLRKVLHFELPSLYYVVIVLNLFLRCTWSFKLSPHLDHFNDLEGGVFLMQVLEVFRRWLWIFLRAETEWVRLAERGPGVGDLLMGEYSNKIDED